MRSKFTLVPYKLDLKNAKIRLAKNCPKDQPRFREIADNYLRMTENRNLVQRSGGFNTTNCAQNCISHLTCYTGKKCETRIECTFLQLSIFCRLKIASA